MLAFLRDSVRFLCIVAGGAIASTAVALATTPLVLDWIESSGRIVPYEGAIRIFFAIALFFFQALWLAMLFRYGSRLGYIVWGIVTVAVVAFATIFVLDTTHRLQEEYAWIRYTTAAFLWLTSAVALLLGIWYHRAEVSVRRLRWLWWVLSLVFFYAAIDEIFQTHEAFGKYIEQTFRIGHEFTDYITVAYAIIGLLFFGYFVAASFREYIPRHMRFAQMFFLGAIVYLLSTLLDTFDVWVHAQLTAWAAQAQATSPFIFSDFWYPLYAPRQFMNGLEEVFENLAAALFAASFLLLLFEKNGLRLLETKLRFPRSAIVFGVLLVVIGCGVVGRLGVASYIGSTVSPALGIDPSHISAIVRAKDGLFHTDDLSWHPSWGLIIANEGKGNVFRWWPATGTLTILPDPQHLLRDTDSVVALDRAIYVADGSRRRIFRYTEEKGWETFLTKKDGLDHPEGLAVSGENMYVVDETARTLSIVSMRTKQVQKIPLKHKRLRTPEGIAMHPELGVLMTDDTTGHIVRFVQKDLLYTGEVFANPSDGLKNPEGIAIDPRGNIWVTDNGRREIIEFSKEGNVLRRIKFHRMYGDLQGIAWGKNANGGDALYVVTADGYGSASFMPSTVWQVRLDVL